MNNLLAGATALILALALLGLGKRPRKTFLQSNHTQSPLWLTPEEAGLVETSGLISQQETGIPKDGQIQWEKPKTTQQKINLQRHLYKSINSDPDQRLEAVRIAGEWGHKSVLPILLRGLKDSDTRVISMAAAAIQAHRGVSTTTLYKETVRPPRNVSLMR